MSALAVSIAVVEFTAPLLYLVAFIKFFTRFSSFLHSRVGRSRRILIIFFLGDFLLRLAFFIKVSCRFRNPLIVLSLSLGKHYFIFLLQRLFHLDLEAGQLQTALYQCILCTNLFLICANLFLICLLLHCILLHIPQRQTLKYHDYSVNHSPYLKDLKGDHYEKSVCIRSFSGPYLVQMLENTDQKNSEYGHFLRRE